MKKTSFYFPKIFLIFVVFGFGSLAHAGGVLTSNSAPILSPIQMSIVGQGMGNAIVGDGTLFNATSFNPALLGQAPDTLEILQLGLSVSNDDFSVFNYLDPNGFSFDFNGMANTISNTINNSINAINPSSLSQNLINGFINPSSANNALVTASLTSFDNVANNLTNKAIETGVGDNFSVKVTPNFGLEVFESAHAFFEFVPGSLIQQLTHISLPYGGSSSLGSAVTILDNTIQTTLNQILTNTQQGYISSDITALKNGTENISTFQNNITPILASHGVTNVNPGNLASQITTNIAGNLGYLNALAYSDTVAMATIDFNPFEDFPLTVGINGKVVRRYFSWANLTLSTSSANSLSTLQDDIEQPTTRWGIDLGFLYALEPDLNLGISFTDLIAASATIPNASIPGDILYGVVTDPAPTVTRVGLSWHPIHELSLNSDLDDMFSTTSYYTGLDLFSHFKFGAALSLAGILQLRGGFSDGNFDGGAGVQLGFLGLDYSYAMDDLSYSYNHYAQLKIVF